MSTQVKEKKDSRLENIFVLLKDSIDYLKKKYSINYLGVFGSYARLEETENSDIDILIEFDTIIDLFQYVHLEDYLSDKLGKKVDLVIKSSIKPFLKNIILDEVIVIWQKEK